MVLIVNYSKKEAKCELLKYGDIIFESKVLDILFLKLKDNILDRNILLSIDGVDSIEEEAIGNLLHSDIKFYAYINGARKTGSLQEMYDFYDQGSNNYYKAIGVDYLNPYSKMDSSIDLLVTRDGIEKISNDYISLNLQEKLQNAVNLIKDLLECNKSCLNCEFYDTGNNCCMYKCAVKAILNEDETAKDCISYRRGIYNQQKLEKNNYI